MRGLGSVHSCRPFRHVSIFVFFSASHASALARRARNCNTKLGGGGFEMAAFSAGADKMPWIGHKRAMGQGTMGEAISIFSEAEAAQGAFSLRVFGERLEK
jgi:hypothetical protein